MLRDPDEAEDAAQQTFLSAYANLLGGTKPREPAPWLATIARNECRSRVQRRMREPLPEVVPEAERSDPAFRAAQASDVESLRLALAGLPLQQRRAFLLREFTGLSYNELALALGVTQPAVESLLFRARRQLRGLLRARKARVGAAAREAGRRHRRRGVRDCRRSRRAAGPPPSCGGRVRAATNTFGGAEPPKRLSAGGAEGGAAAAARNGGHPRLSASRSVRAACRAWRKSTERVRRSLLRSGRPRRRRACLRQPFRGRRQPLAAEPTGRLVGR